VLYIMLSGMPPFYDDDHFKLFDIIKKGEYDFNDIVWTCVSDEAKDLIERLLVVDPNDRITAEEIMDHPWVMGNFTTKANNVNQVHKNMKKWRRQTRVQL